MMVPLHENILIWTTCGGMLTLVGFTIATYTRVGKIEKDGSEKRRLLEESTSAKVSRVYTRLDEVKLLTKEEYVNKEVCGILHRQIDSRLAEIASDVKLLIKNGRQAREG